MSYYKIIDGKKMDSRLLEIAETSVQGAGDGRISKNDAIAMMQAVKRWWHIHRCGKNYHGIYPR